MNTSIKRIAYTLCTLLSLVVFSPTSHAKWVDIGDSHLMTYYVDMANIRRDGNMAKVWTLINFKSVQFIQGKPYLSSKEQYQVNCKEEISKHLYSATFKNQMGTGDVVDTFTYRDTQWEPAPPDSIRAIMGEIACGRLKP